MTYQEQHKALENRIISSLCEIKEYPCELFPHSVFVEEVGEDCGPVYNKYSLVSINQSEKTCMLKSSHSREESEFYLSSISIDWLVTVWNRCQELISESGKFREHAVCYLLEHTDAEPDYIAEYVAKNWRLSFHDEANLATFNECRKQVDYNLETYLRNLLEVASVGIPSFKPCCGNCLHFTSEIVKEPSFVPGSYWEREKNLRCGIGGFKVGKSNWCQEHKFNE